MNYESLTKKELIERLRELESALASPDTEKSVIQESLWFSETLASIGDAVCATDAKGIVTYLNPTAEELTGWKSHEAKGRPVEEILVLQNEVTGKTARMPVVEVLRTGEKKELENHTLLIAKNGNRIPIDDSAAPIIDEKGEINGVVMVFRNVSEKRLQKEQSERLASIIKGSSDAIVSMSLDGTVETWNRSAESMFGYTHEEIVGKSAMMLADEKGQQEQLEVIQGIISGREFEHFETTGRRKDGMLVHLSMSVSSVKNNLGEIAGLSVIARDITAQKNVQESLRVEREKYQQVFKTTEEAIFVIRDGLFYQINDSGLRMFEVEEDEIIGKSPLDFSPEFQPDGKSSRKSALMRIEAAVSGKPQKFLWTHMTKSKRDFRAEIVLNSFDIEGEVFLQAFVRDITEKERAERAREEARRFTRDVLQFIPSPIYVVDEEGKIAFKNQAFDMIFPEEDGIPAVLEELIDEFNSLESGRIVTKERFIPLNDKDDAYFLITEGVLEGGSRMRIGFMTDLTEMKKAEKLIAEREARIKSIIESMPIMVDAFDSEGRPLVWNRECERVTGYKREEMIGNTDALSLLYPDNKNLTERLKKMENDGFIFRNWEWELEAKNGQKRTVLFSNLSGEYPIEGWHTWAVGIDITELKAAEGRLQESERKYKALFTQMISGYALQRPIMAEGGNLEDYIFEETNPALLNLMEIPDGQLVGQRASELFVVPPFVEYYDALIKTGQPVEFETFYYAIGRWLSVNAFMIDDGNFAVVIDDITQRKQAEEALEKSSYTLQQITAASPTVIYIRDLRDDSIHFQNRHIAENLGYSIAEIETKGAELFDEMILEEDRSDIYEIQEQLKNSFDNSAVDYEYRVVDRKGDIRWLGVREVVFSRDDDYRPQEILGLIDEITQRKAEEELLRRSEERLALATKGTGIAIWDYDVSKDFLEWDDGMYKLFGLETHEFHNSFEDWSKCVLPQALPMALRDFQAALSGERDFYIEFPIVRKDGVRHLAGAATVIRNESGEPKRVIGVNYDITERKMSEAAIRESEIRYRTLFETMVQGISYHDDKGRLLSVNPAAEQILGESYHELLGRDLFSENGKLIAEDGSLFPRDKLPSTIALQTGEKVGPVLFGVENIKDGKIRWLNVTAIPLKRKRDNTVYEMYITFQDMTEFKNYEFQLRRLLRAVEQSIDGFCVLDNDWRIDFANHSFARMYGISVDDMHSEPFTTLLPTKDVLKEFKDKLLRDSAYQMEMEHRRHSGDRFPALTSISRITDQKGRPEGFICLVRDLSEMKKIEDENQRIQNQLLRSQKMETIGTLAGGIAHDFNNILTPILGFVELCLLDVEKQTLLYSNFMHIRKGALRAKELVKQILTFSRHTEQARRYIKLDMIVREALKLLASSLPSSIEIKSSISRDCCTIYGDPTQMHQVLMNLCTNAFQAMEERTGLLEVSLAKVKVDDMMLEERPGMKSGEYNLLTVSDNGRGMDQKTKDRIFEPFFTTKSVGEGTGLGLSVVHGILTNHDGYIFVKSEQGKGTTFELYLPCRKEEAEGKVETDLVIPEGNEVLMVIDDEIDILQMTQLILQRFGYDVRIFQSSEDALRAFQENPDEFDLIITDQTMPKMTGGKLASSISKVAPHIPIILITGYSETINVENKERYGVSELLFKPLDYTQFGQVIRRLLDGEK